VWDVEKEASNYNKSGKERGSGKLQLDPVRRQSAGNDSVCRKEAFGSGVLIASEGQSPCPGDDDEVVGKATKTTQRRRKMKGLTELGISHSHPRRSARLISRYSQAGISVQPRQGLSSVSLSDGDIGNCNIQLNVSESEEEPAKLWEISRRVGTMCRGDEKEAVNEYSNMEARDLEILKGAEEGRKDRFL